MNTQKKMIYTLSICMAGIVGACTSEKAEETRENPEVRQQANLVAALKEQLNEMTARGELGEENSYKIREEHAPVVAKENRMTFAQSSAGAQWTMGGLIYAKDVTPLKKLNNVRDYVEELRSGRGKDAMHAMRYLSALHMLTCMERAAIEERMAVLRSDVVPPSARAEASAMEAYFTQLFEEEFPKHWRKKTSEEAKKDFTISMERKKQVLDQEIQKLEDLKAAGK